MRPARRSTKVRAAAAAIFARRNARSPKDARRSRSARANRMSAPVEGARAPGRWAAATRASKPHEDEKLQQPLPARATDTRDASFMRGLGKRTLRDDQR